VLADELGFTDAWISEHHAEPLYAGKVDVMPLPELLMCKAAALTKRIHFGAAVKVIHLSHPVDIAIQAATADNLIGDDRYMFGFGTGFPNPLFSEERGLTYEDRHERTLESLALILKCWEQTEPFDWEGRFWQGRNIVVLPKPMQRPHMPMATASLTPATLALAGERGYMVLTGGSPASVRKYADMYAAAALEAGRTQPLEKIIATASIYIADSVAEAIEDIREGVEHEMVYQRERGLLRMMAPYLATANTEAFTFDDLVAHGLYVVGDPDTVYRQLEQQFHDAGGFGTLLYRCGKDWTTRAKVETSMRRFMAEVAPRLAKLQADRIPAVAA
jgi:alkanesulfonate monooxygenase SsuD/methylene tetrahydromethanopterin reductase-like flavin-dependent oxidoreductase (luciferase family)